VWALRVSVTDLDGYAVDAASATAVTVTLPGGTTSAPTVETVTTGDYRATYTAGTAGRYVARVVVTGYGAADFAAYAAATTTGTGMPDVTAVANYLGADASSWDTDDLQDALDAEASAQRDRCRVPAVYPDSLRQALLRRVQRNLAMRRLPLAVLQGDAEATRIGGNDPEVRRFEAPYRKLVIG